MARTRLDVCTWKQNKNKVLPYLNLHSILVLTQSLSLYVQLFKCTIHIKYRLQAGRQRGSHFQFLMIMDGCWLGGLPNRNDLDNFPAMLSISTKPIGALPRRDRNGTEVLLNGLITSSRYSVWYLQFFFARRWSANLLSFQTIIAAASQLIHVRTWKSRSVRCCYWRWNCGRWLIYRENASNSRGRF